MHKPPKTPNATNGAMPPSPQQSNEAVEAAVQEDFVVGKARPEQDTGAAQPKPDVAATANAEAQREVDALREQLLRMAADFDNFRKRTRQEQDDSRRYGSQRMLADLLPVLDNLERALAHAPQDSQDPVLQGVRMVAKQCGDVLGNHGVKPFLSHGTRFDPERHEAVGQQTSPTNAPGTVLTELQSGYMIHERLLRPARVVVADQTSGADIR